MATTNYHVTGTTGVGSSTAMPKKGFKLEVPAADGILVVFDKRFWSVKNLGKTILDADSANDVYFRHGIALPTASYAADNAAKQESLVIQSGCDELIQIKSGDNSNAVCFLAKTAGVVLQFRPNSADYK